MGFSGGYWGMQDLERNQMKVIQGGNQMSLIRDTEEVLKFLEFVGRKHILSEHAVNCRLTACNNLFAVLNEEEDHLDYILQNLDVLTNRFRNSNPNVQASTLKVYKSRVKSSMEDFKEWSADPFLWERSITDKAKATKSDHRKDGKKKTKKVEAAPETKPAPRAKTVETKVLETPSAGQGHRVSFPLRSGCRVEMVLPEDGITLKELKKLGLFLYPYCKDMDPENPKWPQLS